MKHYVDPLTKNWIHIDEDHNVWSCPCRSGHSISLCLTIDETLKKEGELNELKHQIAMKRKELGLLVK
ncbi:MAG: hypothetical protein AABY22_20705 [Nanoarchaeota archaeon]